MKPTKEEMLADLSKWVNYYCAGINQYAKNRNKETFAAIWNLIDEHGPEEGKEKL